MSNDSRILISISREYGSGGRDIGKALAKRLGITLYDSDLLKKACEELGCDYSDWKPFEETSLNPLLTRSFGEFSTAPQDHVAEMEFSYIRDKIEEGESFVIVGRCGANLIKEHSPTLRVFTWADEDFRIKRIMKRHELDRSEAIQMMKKKDKGRRAYTERFSDGRWDDPKKYDLFINSGELGIENVVKMIEFYVKGK